MTDSQPENMTTDTTNDENAAVDPRTGKPLKMTPDAIKARKYRARKKAREAGEDTTTPTTKPTTKRTAATSDAARIAELERQLAQVKAERDAAKTVMVSARVPGTLRDQVRDASGGRSLQAIVCEALELWLEANQ